MRGNMKQVRKALREAFEDMLNQQNRMPAQELGDEMGPQEPQEDEKKVDFQGSVRLVPVIDNLENAEPEPEMPMMSPDVGMDAEPEDESASRERQAASGYDGAFGAPEYGDDSENRTDLGAEDEGSEEDTDVDLGDFVGEMGDEEESDEIDVDDEEPEELEDDSDEHEEDETEEEEEEEHEDSEEESDDEDEGDDDEEEVEEGVSQSKRAKHGYDGEDPRDYKDLPGEGLTMKEAFGMAQGQQKLDMFKNLIKSMSPQDKQSFAQQLPQMMGGSSIGGKSTPTNHPMAHHKPDSFRQGTEDDDDPAPELGAERELDFGEAEESPVSQEKAKTIMKHGEVKGNPLSDKQKGLFGAIAGGQKLKK